MLLLQVLQPLQIDPGNLCLVLLFYALEYVLAKEMQEQYLVLKFLIVIGNTWKIALINATKT